MNRSVDIVLMIFDTNISPKPADDEMWMLTIYGKSDKATIPGHQLKKIAEAISNDKS